MSDPVINSNTWLIEWMETHKITMGYYGVQQISAGFFSRLRMKQDKDFLSLFHGLFHMNPKIMVSIQARS